MKIGAHLVSREVIPFVGALAALVAAALLSDAVLHALHAAWIGRYLGVPGTLLIVASFTYSLRKRKLITAGHPGQLLRAHEAMAWLGTLFVLVHAGIHLNAILAWLAVAAMLVNVGSGLTGKFLLDRSRRRLLETQQRMRQGGLSETDVEDRTYWDSLTFDAVKQWRSVHFPITLAFIVLSVAHITAVFVFWGWR